MLLMFFVPFGVDYHGLFRSSCGPPVARSWCVRRGDGDSCERRASSTSLRMASGRERTDEFSAPDLPAQNGPLQGFDLQRLS